MSQKYLPFQDESDLNTQENKIKSPQIHQGDTPEKLNAPQKSTNSIPPPPSLTNLISQEIPLPPPPPTNLLLPTTKPKLEKALTNFKKGIRAAEGLHLDDLCNSFNEIIIEPKKTLPKLNLNIQHSQALTSPIINYNKIFEVLKQQVIKNEKISANGYEIGKIIVDLSFINKDNDLLCLTKDGGIKQINIKTGKFIDHNYQKTNAMTVSADGSLLFLANDEHIIIIDFKRTFIKKKIPLVGEKDLSPSKFEKGPSKFYEQHQGGSKKSIGSKSDLRLDSISFLLVDSKVNFLLSLNQGINDYKIGVWELTEQLTGTEKNYFLESKIKKEPIISICFFPKDNRLVSGSKNGTISIWNIQKKEEVLPLPPLHEKGVNALIVCGEGLQIISGGEDRRIVIWRCKKNTINFEPYTVLYSEQSIVSLKLLPEERNLISGSKGRVFGWNLLTGQRFCVFDGYSPIAVSSDGRTLCSAGKNHSLGLWSITYAMNSFSLISQTEGIIQVSISNDKKKAVALGKDRVMRVWELEEGYLINAIKNIGFNERQNKSPFSLFSDNNRVISLARDNAGLTMEIWNINTGESLKLLKGHKAFIEAFQLCNEDKNLYSISDDGQVLKWEIEENVKFAEFGFHKASVLTLVIINENETLVSGGKDGSIKIWNNKPFLLPKGHTEVISCLKFLKQNNHLFSAALDKKIIIWDTTNWSLFRILSDNCGKVNGMDFFMQGLSWKLIVAGANKSLDIWDLTNYDLTTLNDHHKDVITCVNANDQWILSGSDDGEVIMVNKNEEFKDFELEKYSDEVQEFVFLKNRSEMLLAKRNSLFIKEMKNPSKDIQLMPIKHKSNIELLSVSYDNKYAVTGSTTDQGPKFFLWNISERKFIKELEGLKESPIRLEIFNNTFYAGFNPSEEKTEKKVEKKKDNLAKVKKTDLNSEKFQYFEKDFQIDSLNKINALKLIIYANESEAKIIIAGEKIHDKKLVNIKIHGLILILDKDLDLKKKISTKEDVATLIEIVPNGANNTLFCANKNKTISIWNINQEVLVSKINVNFDVKSLSFIPKQEEKDDQRLLGFINNMIFDFESNKFLTINKWSQDKMRQHFAFKDNEYFAINQNFEVEKYSSIFCTKNRLDVLSSMNSLKGFFELDSKQQNDESNQSIFIGNEVMFPFYFNLLHLIALSGNKPPFVVEDLNSLCPDLDMFLTKDCFENTCFDILIQMSNKELFKDFLNLLLKELNSKRDSVHEKVKFFAKQKGNHGSYYILVKAFEYYGSAVLEELMNHGILDYDSFGHGIMMPEMEKPIYMIVKNLQKIEPNKLKNMLEKKIEGRKSFFQEVLEKFRMIKKGHDGKKNTILSKIKCKIICIENFMEINEEMITFFDNINELDPSNKIFCNELMDILANYKWEAYAYNHQRRQFFLFMFFFVLLSVNFFYFFPIRMNGSLEDLSFEYLMTLILDTLVFCYILYYTKIEFMEFLSRKMSYITSGYNWIDIGLVAICTTTLALDVLNLMEVYNEHSILKEFISVTFFLFWLRVIIFLRGLSGTAFMITLIVQVIKDIRYFLLLIFLFLLAFNSSTYFLQESFNSTSSFGFMGTFTLFYRLLLGDFNDYDEINVIDSYFLWIVMLLFTLLLVIVLLNLLISIISDSFGKVFSVKKQARTYELLNLINAVDRSLNKKERKKLREQEKIGNYIVMFYNTEKEKELDLPLESYKTLKKLVENHEENAKTMEEFIKKSDLEAILKNILQPQIAKINESLESFKKNNSDNQKKSKKNEKNVDSGTLKEKNKK